MTSRYEVTYQSFAYASFRIITSLSHPQVFSQRAASGSVYKKIVMPRRCAVPGSGQTKCLNMLPNDPDIREKWMQFIFCGRPSHGSVNLSVCSLHFKDDCFENKSQYDAGFARKLLLKDQAVPTILGQQ